MRKLLIILYFWVFMTIALRLGQILTFPILCAIFLVMFNLAEKIDEED